MALKKFKILSGTHSEGGKLYGPGKPDGDIVPSTFNLDKLFENKFRPVTADDLAAAPAAAAAPVSPAQEKPVSGDSAAPTPQAGDPEPAPAYEPKMSKLGTDVSANFPEAIAAELLILKGGSKSKPVYFIAEPDKPDKAVKKDLKETEVLDAVKALLA